MKSNHTPSILIVTTPLRQQVSFPPFGSFSVITSLRKSNFNETKFYNIDLIRPSFLDAVDYIAGEKPDILGISAVVSTAYEYTKKLSLEVKKRLPKTTILLGGNLGASAEVLLKKTGVDFICTGEGERTAVEFANCWMTADSKDDFLNVRGLTFIDVKGNMVVTPFQDPIDKQDVYDIDWSFMSREEKDAFFPLHETVPKGDSFFHDPRALQPHRRQKTIGHLLGSKGCVARCTFCHRWEKGIRYIPVPTVMERLDLMIDKYNIGFVVLADENFGTDRKWLAFFLEEITKRDVLWRVSGMRVNTMKSETIKKMKEAGCTTIYCGMESGSQKMLDVMEKVTKVEQNFNAVKWMAENVVHTAVQLVIGMPGETPETIEETCKFTSFFVEQSPSIDPNLLSINFAQALPGTPLYETARRKGDIDPSIDGEEKYLIQVSDKDARDGDSYINFTDYPRLFLEKWNFDIQNTTRNSYVKKWGLANYYRVILKNWRYKNLIKVEGSGDSGYFADPARQNEIINKDMPIDKVKIPSLWALLKKKRIGLIAAFYPQYFWKFRFLTLAFVFGNCLRKYDLKYSLKLVYDYLYWNLTNILKNKNSPAIPSYISLRKLLRSKIFPEIESDNPSMSIFRKGR